MSDRESASRERIQGSIFPAGTGYLLSGVAALALGALLDASGHFEDDRTVPVTAYVAALVLASAGIFRFLAKS